MLTPEILKLGRAKVTIHQERPYDFDEKRGIWLYRQVDEDVEGFNLVTDAGRVAIHTYIYGTTAQRASAGLGTGLNYIGITNDGTAPAAGDTTLAAELTGNGLDRAQGTPTLPVGAGTITSVQKVFTYTGGGSQGVQKTALFDAATSGKMAHEILFTQRTLFTNDTLTVTFQITLA